MTLAAELGADPDAVARLIAGLAAAGLTVATAESLTAGLVTAVLTEVPGSSAVVRGGLVVYATDLKATLAGVDADLLARHGPVHPRVARELAAGARVRCAAEIGLGLTGVAGPEAQGGAPVGTVHLALSAAGWERAATLSPDDVRGLAGGSGAVDAATGAEVRAAVRAAAARRALALLEEFLRHTTGTGTA